MADKTFWIADALGAHAVVAGEDERDQWVRGRGWADAAEPSGFDQVHIVNGDMHGCVPFAALAEGWADLGWSPGPPPEPVNILKDPALVDQAAPPIKAAPPAKPSNGVS